MLRNYHTHTTRCKHAEGTDEEYVLAAIKKGYKVLGFSDHTPWPIEGQLRMAEEELKDYCDSINHLKEKYKDQIEIKLGLEAEYVPEWMDWLKEKVEQYGIEYLIFGNHWYRLGEREIFFGAKVSKSWAEGYLEFAINGLKTGLYSYFAHPDWFVYKAYWWDDTLEEASRKICMYCKEHGIPLEYNLGGVRACLMYPHPDFWRIAKECGCKAIIGVDAHSPEHILDEYSLKVAKDELELLGIEVVDNINHVLKTKEM